MITSQESARLPNAPSRSSSRPPVGRHTSSPSHWPLTAAACSQSVMYTEHRAQTSRMLRTFILSLSLPHPRVSRTAAQSAASTVPLTHAPEGAYVDSIGRPGGIQVYHTDRPAAKGTNRHREAENRLFRRPREAKRKKCKLNCK